MFCSKCGSQIDDAAVFCSKCGTKINLGQDISDTSPKAPLTPSVSSFEPEVTLHPAPQGFGNEPASDFMAWCIVGLDCATAFYILANYLLQNKLMLNLDIGKNSTLLPYFIGIAFLALKIFCAKIDSDKLRLRGYSPPSIGWAFFLPPVYLIKRSNVVHQARFSLSALLLTFLSISAIGISVYLPIDSELFRSKIEQTAADIVTQIIEKRFSGNSECRQVKLTNRIIDNRYEAIALLNNGRSLKINIEVEDDRIGVSLAPALDLLSSLGDLFPEPNSFANKKDVAEIISNLRELRSASIMFIAENSDDKNKVMESLVNTKNSVKSLLGGFLGNPDGLSDYFFSFFEFEKGEKWLMVGYNLSQESSSLRQTLQDRANSLGLYDEHSKSWSDRYSGGDFVYMQVSSVTSETSSDTSLLSSPEAAGKLLEEKLKAMGWLSPSERVFQEKEEEEVINGEPSWLFVTSIEGSDMIHRTGYYAVSKSGKLYEMDIAGSTEFVPLGEASHRKEQTQEVHEDITSRLNPQFTRSDVSNPSEYICKGTITVTTDGSTLNLREGPSLSYKVIGKLQNGKTYPVQSWSWDEAEGTSNTQWFLVDDIANQISGWVNGSFCRTYLTYSNKTNKSDKPDNKEFDMAILNEITERIFEKFFGYAYEGEGEYQSPKDLKSGLKVQQTERLKASDGDLIEYICANEDSAIWYYVYDEAQDMPYMREYATTNISDFLKNILSDKTEAIKPNKEGKYAADIFSGFLGWPLEIRTDSKGLPNPIAVFQNEEHPIKFSVLLDDSKTYIKMIRIELSPDGNYQNDKKYLKLNNGYNDIVKNLLRKN